jgi:hypothetical protein
MTAPFLHPIPRPPVLKGPQLKEQTLAALETLGSKKLPDPLVIEILRQAVDHRDYRMKETIINRVINRSPSIAQFFQQRGVNLLLGQIHYEDIDRLLNRLPEIDSCAETTFRLSRTRGYVFKQ